MIASVSVPIPTMAVQFQSHMLLHVAALYARSGCAGTLRLLEFSAAQTLQKRILSGGLRGGERRV